MSVTELRPTPRATRTTKTSTTPSAKAADAKALAEAEALRAKTAATAAASDITNQLKAAKAAADIAKGQEAAAKIRQDAADAARQAEQDLRAKDAARQKAERSAAQWRTWAKTLAVVCVLVSLPLQAMAFYSPHAPFLLLAPVVLEGLAWAMLKGAEAAIDDDRPSWHYRLGALSVALFAASINFIHGQAAFGLGTGLGAAFCSIAGPALWDLHEHGRIATKEARPTRRQRHDLARQAAAKVAAEKAKQAAADELRDALETTRSVQWPQVWERAVALAAAVGELHPSDAVWKRAWDDVEGGPLGDNAAAIAARVAAKAAVKTAANGQASTPAKAEKAQVEFLMPTPANDGRRHNGNTPPRRSPGDTPRYSAGARNTMAVAARRQRAQRAAG